MRGPRSAAWVSAILLLGLASDARPQALPLDSIVTGAPCALVTDGGGDALAVVLSGGGARGLAHIGVLRVLDSLGVRPTLVVGTSMGSLVGALYAGGVTGAELDAVARRLPLEPLFRGYAPATAVTTTSLQAPATVVTPVFVLEWRDRGLSLRSPVAREQQLNALINDALLHLNLVARGDFDRLPRRYRAVATDARTDSAVVLRGGDLAQAVRASIAIPVVFAPVPYDGALLVDGGLSANLPIAEARRSGGRRIVISDVGSPPPDSGADGTTASMVNYLIDALFTQPLDPLHADDVRIRPAVRHFNPLVFSRDAVGALIDQGYADARRAFAGCPVRRHATPADSARSDIPAEPLIRDRLERLASDGAYEAVWLNPTDSSGALAFAPRATLAAERLISGDIAYDAHDGARVSLATAHLAPAGGRLRASAALTASAWRQSFEVQATGLRVDALPRAEGRETAAGPLVALPDPRAESAPWSTRVRLLLRPELGVAGSREIVRLYDARGRDRERPTTRDLVGFAGLSGTPATGWEIAGGAIAHVWSVHSAALPEDSGDHGIGGMLRTAWFLPPPISGPDPNMIPSLSVEGLWLDRYRRASAHADLRVDVGRLTMRPRAAAGWGESLPLSAQFAAGGTEGFPGLRTGERRGDRFWFAALALVHPLVGPVHVRAELGAGATSFNATRVREVIEGAAAGWVRGGELGIMLDTPLGTLVAGYGAASNGRPVVKIRLGS